MSEVEQRPLRESVVNSMVNAINKSHSPEDLVFLVALIRQTRIGCNNEAIVVALKNKMEEFRKTHPDDLNKTIGDLYSH